MVTGKIGNRGQILIFLALGLVVLGLMVGLALDGGRAYLTHARLSRTVDAAAMVGARELLFGEDKAVAAACDLIAVNGGGIDCGGDGRFSVRIGELEEYGNILPAVFVTGRTVMRTSFMRLGLLIGCSACDELPISALGAAIPPPDADILLVLDDTGSMRNNPHCNANQSNGCPTNQERKGASRFVEIFTPLIAAGHMRIGLLPFRGCYNADGTNGCVDNDGATTDVVGFTENTKLLLGNRGVNIDCPGPYQDNTDCPPDTGGGIAGLWAQGGSGTNVCLALQETRKRVGPAETGKIRIVVLLTDAHNQDGGGLKWACGETGSDNGAKTLNAAAELKSDGVQIFILGYGVDGNNDRQLAKAIASPGSYFEAPSAEELLAAFEAIARELLKKVRLAV